MTAIASVTTPPVNKGAGVGCLRVFFLIFLLAGLGFFYGILVRPVWRILRARDWEPADCRITSSKVASSSDSDGTTYRADIHFAYKYQGRQYNSDQYSFTRMYSSGVKGKKEVVSRYPVGRAATCFVNPKDPAEAVIERGATPELWWGFFPLPFIAVGLFGMIYAPRMANRGNVATGPISTTIFKRGKTPAYPAPAPLPGAIGGPKELRSTSSPVGKFVGMIIGAIFWNGIISIFLWHAWNEWRHGHPSWFLNIFLIPFVAVGLGLIGGIFYTFLGLFNPRLVLVVNPSLVALGGTQEIQWSFRGNASRLRTFTLVLEALERATYRRGTDTATDDNVFLTIPLVDIADAGMNRAGSATLNVPPGVMHSFKAANNEILWRLKGKGRIRWFPDVSEEFVLTVLPQPTRRP